MRYNNISLLLLILTISCKTADKEKVVEQVGKPVKNLIIAERIDGPAHIRNSPNEDILFELYDNALVEATELKEDWLQVLVYADIRYEEYGLDSITKGRYIISKEDTIGRIIKTHPVSIMQGKNNAYVLVQGYTHKNNIKPETIIENALQEKLAKAQRNLSYWTEFIRSFELDSNAVDYQKFDTYFNYENTIDDPSPGFRVVLLFDDGELVGFIHSRTIKFEKMETHKLDWSYFISFFDDFPVKQQLEFVSYMNEWIKGID